MAEVVLFRQLFRSCQTSSSAQERMKFKLNIPLLQKLGIHIHIGKHEPAKHLRMPSPLTTLPQTYSTKFHDSATKRLERLWFGNGNDSFGHLAGDKLLKEAAEIIQQYYREEEASMPLSLALGCATRISAEHDIRDIINKAEDRMYRKKMSNDSRVKDRQLSTLMKTLERKSREIQKHISSMNKLALKMAESINLESTDIEKLKLLITLHDIGNINISENTLTKPGALTDREWATIKDHPIIGYRIAIRTDDFSQVAKGVIIITSGGIGSGYPDGLQGEDIPII